MSESIKNALEYVRNTNGGAGLTNFLEDWEPIGDRLWVLLTEAQPEPLVRLNEDRRAVLTPEGKAALEAAQADGRTYVEGCAP